MNPSPVDVLFVCKDRLTYGLSYGLANSATFVCNYLNEAGIKTKVVHATDGNSVDALVTQYDPLYVVVEALWITPDKLRELLAIQRHAKRTWVIRIHSRLAFLANEGMAFEWLLGYRDINADNVYIAPNTRELADDLDASFDLQTIYLPNIYYPEHISSHKHQKHSRKEVNIGCFGAIRPMKNHLTQAVAAVKFADYHDLRLNFHINATRTEQKGDNVLKNLRSFFAGQCHHTLVEHDWMTHHKFLELIRDMDMGMQVSLTESFNIVAADFVMNDIPVVGSSQIKWLPGMFQADCNSTESIFNTMLYAWGPIGYFLRRLSKGYLRAANESAQEIWKSFFVV